MALDPIPYTSDVLSTDKLKSGKISDTWHRFLRSWESKFDSLSKVLARLNFINLSDVPQSYTGQGGKVVKVKGAEDGLEFGVAGVTDHTLLTNIGTSTHPQLDTERNNSISHRADTTIHFTDVSVLHNNRSDLQGGAVGERYHLNASRSAEADSFLNGGSATHTQLDSERTASIAHRADTEVHDVPYDEIEYTYTSGKETGTIFSENNVVVKTLAHTYDSSGRPSTITDGSDTWTFTYTGTGFLERPLRT